MTKYELKPHNVDAIKFDGRNWHAVEALLGPHLTKKEESYLPPNDIEYYVYDIETKQWCSVHSGFYVVRDHNGAVETMRADVFESKYQESRTSTTVTFPSVPTYGGGSIR